MIRLSLKIFFSLLVPAFVTAQSDLYVKTWSNKEADSLKLQLHGISNDTTQMFIYRCLGYHYQETNKDSSLYFHERQLALAQKLHLKIWEADALDQAGWVLSYLKNYPLSLQYLLEGLKILENQDCEENIWMITLFSKEGNPVKARLNSLGFIYNDLSQLYKGTGNRKKEKSTLHLGLKIGRDISNDAVIAITSANLAQAYLTLNQLDSALYFGQQSLQHIELSGYRTYKGYVLNTVGNIYLKEKQYDLARRYFDSSITANTETNSLVQLPDSYLSLAELYNSLGKIDKAISYAKRAIADDKKFGGLERLNQAYDAVYYLYRTKGNADSAYAYLRLSKILGDSLNKAEKDKIYAYQDIGFNEQLKLKEQENERSERESRIRIYFLIAGIVVCMVFASILLKNNRSRIKANRLLQKQNEEIDEQKRAVEAALSELKSAQAQLIQSAKMASLGELTAGIAHEIQNPLNFVNNFSEVSGEMMGELVHEIKSGHPEEAELIASEIMQNLQKIGHHGKRADSIVKGMLQHSRITNGNRELTNVNELVREYVKLGFHAFLGKDSPLSTAQPGFDVKLQTDFDASIPEMEIAPQEIGRVLLNILNNAFYAVSARSSAMAIAKAEAKLQMIVDPAATADAEKTKEETGIGKDNPSVVSYQPQVSVSTIKKGNLVEITVKDNGIGIPEKIVDKIFQPFFTTKPSGQGTGLGLSLSYDIVTKGHGGTLTVQSKENEGSTFTIQLPA